MSECGSECGSKEMMVKESNAIHARMINPFQLIKNYICTINILTILSRLI